jgi:beta-1,4-N-acetylglucosaminyltransferase
MSDQEHLLIILGAGGHTKQMLRLVDLLGSDYQYQYVVADYDTISEQKIRIPGPVYRIVQPREKRQGETDSVLTVIRKMPSALLQARRILTDAHPAAVIGAGPSLQIPIAIVARLQRIPVIFIETASRGGDSISMTGKIIYKYHLADRFYVQWEHYLQQYPQALFAGRLL